MYGRVARVIKLLPLFNVHIVQANELVIDEIYVNICLFFSVFIFSGYYFHMELICLHVIINEDTHHIHFWENVLAAEFLCFRK